MYFDWYMHSLPSEVHVSCVTPFQEAAKNAKELVDEEDKRKKKSERKKQKKMVM